MPTANRAETCFNGLRCIALHSVLNNYCDFDREFTILSDAGKVTARVTGNSPELEIPGASFDPGDIQLRDRQSIINKELKFSFGTLTGTAVSMGNPHFVAWSEYADLDGLNSNMRSCGEEVSTSPCFLNGTNFELASIKDKQTILMAVWERGVGPTLACGSGATATVCAAVESGKVKANVPVTVKMAGGDLTVTVLKDQNMVRIKGDANHVFDGEIEIP